MSGDGQAPTERALSAFTEKLGEFRGTLPRDEQQVLDTIMATACAIKPDVTGFQHRRPYVELQYDSDYRLPSVYLWNLYEQVVVGDAREAGTPSREQPENA
jgi:hypothetical protein